MEKRVQIISALVEGTSIRSVERMTGVHRDTIMRLMVRTGNNCAAILDANIRDINCRALQLDEIWTYVGCKQRNLTWTDESLDNRARGDQYVFVAIDADTKLVPTFMVGKRDAATTMLFAQELRKRVPGKSQISTDSFKVYEWAIGNTFGNDASYAQIHKTYGAANPGRGRYSPAPVEGTVRKTVWGNPNRKDVSTSYVERQNLTMRMQMRRFTRLTNGFSKKRENLVAALNLHFAWYNFVRVHTTMKTTPAIAANVTPRAWRVVDLLAN
jgi:IS1 family transposase